MRTILYMDRKFVWTISKDANISIVEVKKIFEPWKESVKSQCLSNMCI